MPDFIFQWNFFYQGNNYQKNDKAMENTGFMLKIKYL